MLLLFLIMSLIQNKYLDFCFCDLQLHVLQKISLADFIVNELKDGTFHDNFNVFYFHILTHQ